MSWYIGVWKKFAEFGGRARRSEYWYFVLFNMIAMVVLAAVDNVLGLTAGSGQIGVFRGLYSLAVFLPSLGVAIRRLHDTGRSGWWLLIAGIPLIGAIVLLVFMAQDSHPGSNAYGENPKGAVVTL